MAEVIGTALAVVGVLGTIFEGCVRAYGHFTTATHFDQDSQKMVVKIRIEEMRLVVWGREWGVAEGKLEAHLQENGGMRQLALQILTELHRTVTDVQRLRDRYGLQSPEDGSGATGGKKGVKGDISPGQKEPLAKRPSESGKSVNDRSWRKELTIRAKWVVAGELC